MTDTAALARSLHARRRLALLALLCFAQFLVVMDDTIVNTALPSIQRDLDFEQQDLQWVISAYILSFGGLLLLGGRAADLFGRVRLLRAGLVVFATAALVGAVAPEQELLVAARFAQGIGAAMLSPAAMSILTTSFTESRERATALGAWGAMAGLGAAGGLLLGGLITEALGWRWVLLLHVPLVALVVVGARALLPRDPARDARRARGFDGRGALLATAGLIVLMHALVEAPDSGWGSARTIGELAVAALLLAAFAVNEARVARPLAPPTVVLRRGLLTANSAALLTYGGVFSMFFFLSLYQQNVLGFSALSSGAAFLPVTAGMIVAAAITSQLVPRVGTRGPMVAGALIAAAGLGLLAGIPPAGSYAADVLPGLIVLSLGFGATFVALATAANDGIAASDSGLAAGLLTTFQQVGGALALAVVAAVSAAHTRGLLAGGEEPTAALVEGFQRGFIVCAALAVGGALVAALAPRRRLADLLDAVPATND